MGAVKCQFKIKINILTNITFVKYSGIEHTRLLDLSLSKITFHTIL